MRRLQPHEISQLKKIQQVADRSGESKASHPLRFSDFLNLDGLECYVEISTFQQKLLFYTEDTIEATGEEIQQRIINTLNLVKSLEQEGYLTSWYKASLSEDESALGSESIKQNDATPSFLSDLALAAEVLKFQARHYHLHPSISRLFSKSEDGNNGREQVKTAKKDRNGVKSIAVAVLVIVFSIIVHNIVIFQKMNEQQQTLNQSVSNKASDLQEQLTGIQTSSQVRFDSIENSVEQISKYLQSHEVIISDNTTELGKLTRQQRLLNKQLKGTLRKTDSLIQKINQNRIDSIEVD